ncbi:MAG: hypothetical protein KA170_05655 [Candidatus Promineofilum sp.]|nr:hypothetical protein [Promineifilum sp.]
MTTFPNSPRLLKGALVAIDPLRPLPTVIVFQYNPETLTRRIEARTSGGDAGGGGDRTEVLRLAGPPKETITLAAEIDGSDEVGGLHAGRLATGIYPTLSALEMLLYPASSVVIAKAAQAAAGVLDILPPEAPLVLFVWGAERVLPVRLESFSITEEAHDALLNPVRAKVDLSLQVLSAHDFKQSQPGFSLFMAHHIAKELLASSNIFNSVQSLGAGLKLP